MNSANQWPEPTRLIQPGTEPRPHDEVVHLLLVDDDEDYFVLTSDLLRESGGGRFHLDWAPTYEQALQDIRACRHDACLIDYHLGAHNGLELMRKVLAEGCKIPVVMLTGQGDREVDLEAMQSGAADYLVKDQLDARVLERSIRYAIRRARILQDMSRLVAILEATTDFVSTVDVHGRCTYINAAGRRMVGFSEDENVVGRPLEDLHASWAARIVREQGLPIASERGSWNGETALLSRGGMEIPVSQLILTHRDENGNVEFYSTIARDVTERVAAHEKETRLATVIEQVADCILITNTDGIIEYVNPSFEQLTGYTREEALGQSTRILRSGAHDARYYRDLWETILSGRTWAGRLTNRKKDGSPYEADVTVTPVRDRSGDISNFVSTQRDVTYEREMEEQVRQAQKIEAVGQLAGGVAHDFNNLLTVIGGFSALLMDSIPPDDDQRLYVKEIVAASDRAAKLTRQLLAFGRRQIMQPEILSLNDLILGITVMLRKLVGEHTELRMVLDPACRPVKADPGQLEQVLVNMVINARHAMENGGTLTIECYNYHAGSGLSREYGALEAGDYVVVAITDTGVGMTDEVKARIFEPFFTTRGKEEGTGLGLSTCFGIVKQSGGHIRVYSEPGQGSTFRVYLPASSQESEATRRTEPDPAVQTGHETVLVVEDESALRKLMVDVLCASGYKVLKAIHGLDGLRVAQEHEGPIHLVVTDVVMPKMGGGDMVRELRELRPNAKVLFVSGYTGNALQHRGIIDPDIEFLAKPFSPADLNLKVRAVLDA